MASILVVDDEEALVIAMSALVRSMGHQPIPASSAARALELLDAADVVVSDYAMPQMDGIALLRAIAARDGGLPVLLLTAHGSERVAVRAMKAGAYDYITKPFDFDEMTAAIARAVETRALRVRDRLFSAERTIGRPLIGDSAPMRRLVDAVGRVAPRDLTVLVRGETGTGKELVGALIHAQSRRAAGPLVRFNCAAISDELADAELFGHVRGAFTGAVATRQGYFEQANGGTLILDEVGELSPGIQAALLRALEQGEIQPVGSSKVERVDVRVIACTNRDLEAEARAGRFRADLYYRLAVLEIVVPPLRDRREDIPALALEFARRFREQFGAEDCHLAPELLEALRNADWPGNVRQLENVVARLIAMTPATEIGVDALAATLLSRREPPPALEPGPAPAPAGQDPLAGGSVDLRNYLATIERDVLARMMRFTEGNQSEAARRLGMSRSAFVDKLNKYGM